MSNETSDKYTPFKFIQCDVCRGKKGPLNQPGFYYVPKGNSQSVIECECHKRWVESNKILLDAARNGIWVGSTAQKYTLQSYIGTRSKKVIVGLSKYVEAYDDSNTREIVLYLYGAPGTQKTTFVQFMGLSLIRKGYKVFYTSLKVLSDYIVNPFSSDKDKDEDRKQYLSRIEKSDCLILDDAFDKNISPVYSTGSQSPYIEGFLRERIENQKKGILFVSRNPPNEIRKQGYSDSLQTFVERYTTKRHTLFEMKDVYDTFDIPDMFKGIVDGKD